MIRVRVAPGRALLLFLILPGACVREASLQPGALSDSAVIRVAEGTALTLDRTPDGRALVMDLLGQLWVLPVDGGTARRIEAGVAEFADDREPGVSPDGRWIVTRSDRPGGRGIWLHSLAGDVHRPLTDSAQLLGDDVSAPHGLRMVRGSPTCTADGSYC